MAKQQVQRNGVSPMNPRVKWALLACGHDWFGQRKPRVGSLVECSKCPLSPGSAKESV